MPLQKRLVIFGGLCLGGGLSFVAVSGFDSPAGKEPGGAMPQTQASTTTEPNARQSVDPKAGVPDAYRPSPNLSVSDVVRRQLDALQQADKNEAAINWCYQFAAPSNRAAVGSVENFRRGLRNPTYAPLINHRERLIGRPTVVLKQATVLITVVGENGFPAVFRFVLAQQSQQPFEDCWMTTDVYRIDYSAVARTATRPVKFFSQPALFPAFVGETFADG